MKHIAYVLNPSAAVDITRAELDTLLRLSAGHYDSACKALSTPHTPGATLCGWKFRMDTADTLEVVLTTRELDLLSKVTEQLGDPNPDPIGQALHRSFGEIFHATAKRFQIVPI